MPDQSLDMYKELFSKQVQSIVPPSLRAITPRIEAVNGVNLGQGTCQLPVPGELLEFAKEALSEGFNRYSHPAGHPDLRNALAKKLKNYNQIDANPDENILITCGATGGFEAVCSLLINPGDEVVVFSPYYPYHVNTLRRFGAKIVNVKLNLPGWEFSKDEFQSAVTENTKFVIVNTPGNPTGKVFSKEELLFINGVCEKHGALIVTDEIYEYLTYGGRKHISPASLPELKPRTITLGGYSKTFSITGWRIGYMVVDKSISDPLIQILDSIYICPPTPLQKAVASAIEHFPDSYYQELCKKYEGKRDLVVGGLVKAGFKVSPPQGAYYIIAEVPEKFASMEINDFLSKLIVENKVAGVPSTDFVTEKDKKWLRFCYSLSDDKLLNAANSLSF